MLLKNNIQHWTIQLITHNKQHLLQTHQGENNLLVSGSDLQHTFYTASQNRDIK